MRRKRLAKSTSVGSQRKTLPPDQRLLDCHLSVLRSHQKRLAREHDHPNRRLFFDDLLLLQLLAFFNPTVRSLRALEDFSQLPQLQQTLDVSKACRSTLSDANRVMDAQLLAPLLSDLRGRLPQLPRTDSQLDQLLRQAILFDGSYFHAASSVGWALKRRRRGKGAGEDQYFYRLDLQMCAVSGVPQGVQINGRGTGEAAALASDLRQDVLYIADRGVFSHDLLEKIIAVGSDFVLRIKTSQNFVAEHELPRGETALAAGVLADHTGHLAGNPQRDGADVPVRELILHDPRHPDKPIRILTSLLEVDAAVIGELYRWRWQIELFFRWLKVHANFRFVYSQSQNGLTLAFYTAVIGVMLMYLYSGRRASKYAYSLLCAVAAGQATLQDILPILQRRERESDLAKARLARKKAQNAGQ